MHDFKTCETGQSFLCCKATWKKSNATLKTGHLSNKLFLIQCEMRLNFVLKYRRLSQMRLQRTRLKDLLFNKYQHVYLFGDEHKEIRKVAQIEWKARVGRSGADSQYTCLSILVKRTDENNEKITDADDETYFINGPFHEMSKAALTPYNESLLFVNNDAV